MGAQIVWFKRDLRVDDHAALDGACRAGPTIGVYVFEPEFLALPDSDPCHAAFVRACLVELRAQMLARGGRLLVRVGDAVEVLSGLQRTVGASGLWSHEETGNLWTYARDKRVAAWAAASGVTWHEPWQNGVVRRLATRDGWSRIWGRRMAQPCVSAPDRIVTPDGAAALEDGPIPSLAALGLDASRRTEPQGAGEGEAWRVLRSFLAERSVDYRAAMASPVEGWDGCSRLSPHLAYGTISMRRVHQTAAARTAELKAERAAGATFAPTWLPSLASFQSRLRWHCHFMQKLEDHPALEKDELNPVFRGLRDDGWDEERFAAFCEGRTGYPMVDACMRCLDATGWINFRMRAMLVSFACHHLGLPWQPVGVELARRFVDFEPGIHYSQAQMQAGVTGINTVRIYSPAKQVRDQDPNGVFVRHWVPELEGIPTEHLAEPHLTPPLVQIAAGCRIGREYPAPLVDHAEAYAAARERIASVRRTHEARREAERVLARHGSRKRAPRRRGPRT
jgi:deoxyribodipyrimidine photo-lyase